MIKRLLWSFILVCLFHPAALRAESSLIFPRASFDPNLILGIAVANPTGEDAVVTLTAYGADGQLLSGAGVENPARMTIPAGQQVARISAELFGAGVDPATVAWLHATSPTDGLTGFFLLINSSVTLLDGADLPETSQKLVFNLVRAEGGYTTELSLVNPGGTAANVQVQLAGIPVPAFRQLAIPARGVARLDAASLFQVERVAPGAYVVVDSDQEVAGFELVRNGTADGTGFNARRVSEKLSTLSFLRLSVLGPDRTQLGVVNYSSEPVVLTISVFKPDGTLYDSASLQDNPVTRSLGAGGSLLEDVQAMFGFSGEKTLEGWLTVKSTSAAINGYLIRGNPASGAESGVTSAAQGMRRSLFSHIATAPPYSTGLAVLNPASLPCNLRVVALKPTGEILGSYDTVLQPGQRIDKQLGSADFIPGAADQTGGLIWVKSDLPVYAASGISSESAGSSVPAQEVPETFAPDSGMSTLKLVPPIAIVPPNSSQKFRATGSGAPVWKVNGLVGGSAGSGLISSAGVYTAPKNIPARQAVTITAEVENLAAGASADILDKALFAGSLSVVQSVAYMGSLRKIYAAELTAFSASSKALTPSEAAAAAPVSQIYEVSPGVPQSLVGTYPNENVVKILPFSAADSVEYLLLLGQTTGRIVRMNPVTKESKDLYSGLNKPTSMVFDPVSGDLLVVEQDRITTIPRASLESGAAASSPAATGAEKPESIVSRLAAVSIGGAAGIAVDRCTRRIYLSFADQGTVAAYDPVAGTLVTVASDLLNPGQLLGMYRTGVTCPDSFQLLIAERGADRVDLLVPGSGAVTVWLDAPGIQDLAFTPIGSPYSSGEGVLVAGYTLQQNGEIFLVPMSQLYDSNPPNPPIAELVDRKTDIAVSQTSTPKDATPRATVTYQAKVTNSGPLTATRVVLLDTLPAGSTFVSVVTDRGSCAPAGGSILCNLASLPVEATATVVVRVFIKADAPVGTVSNTMDVSAVEVDPDPADNHNVETTTVRLPVVVGLAIRGSQQSPNAGAPFAVTVTAVDAEGNRVPGYGGTVRFTSSDPGATLPQDYTFTAADNSIHVFNDISLTTAGSQTIGVIEVGTAKPVSGELDLDVNAGSPSVHFSGAPSGGIVAGTPWSLTVALGDSYGNPPEGYLGWLVQFTSTDPQAVLPGGYELCTGGQGCTHTFTDIELRTAGTQTVTVWAEPLVLSPPQTPSAVQTGRVDAVSPVVNTISVLVASAGASSVVVIPGTTTPTAGNAFNITVTARDPFGNTATGYPGTVTFTSSDYTASLPANSTMTGGTGSFPVILRRAGSQTITVSASGFSPDTIYVMVSAGAASRLVLSADSFTIPSGGSTNVNVTVLDAFSNVATGYTGTVVLSSSDPRRCLPGPFSHTFGPSDNGSYAFGSLTLVTAGAQTIDATGTPAGTLAASLPVTVTPSPNPQVSVASTSPPIIPGGFKEACFAGPYSPVPDGPSACPLLAWNGYTYWAFSDVNNQYFMDIVAFDCAGNMVRDFGSFGGARYLWQITVDPQAQTVTFWGQDSAAIVIPWSGLSIP